MAQIDVQQMMFRTSVMPDLIAGRISMCFCNIAQTLPLVRMPNRGGFKSLYQEKPR